jgi:hypothetical protein
VLVLVLGLPARAAGDGAAAPTPTAGVVRFPGISIDPAGKRIEVEATFAVTDAFLEYLLVAEGGKAHESLFIAGCRGEHLQLGLIALGLEARPEVHFQGEPLALSGPRVAIEAVWEEGSARRTERVEDLLQDVRLGRAMERVGFAFTGSRFVKNPAARRDPAAPRELLAAAASGSLIAVYHDPDAVLDNPLVAGGDVPLLVPTFRMVEVAGWVAGDERYRARRDAPARGTRAVLVIRPIEN